MTKTYRFLLTAFCVLALHTSTKADVPRLLIVAHRGLLRHAPENTLANFRACLELRLGFEFDVQRTKDGHLVCIHDDTVGRTTDGTGKVAEMTLAELRKLDAGGWFDPKFAGEKVPTEFERQGISGVDLYISTFGPVLAIISENWPVLTSETNPNTGDPLPLKPGDALDLSREEVINLRKQGLLLGRSVEFDPVTDWYLMAWDAFKAQEFPADEARKLALALGLDLERDIIRDKKLVAKKSGTVVINQPQGRRKRAMVDPDGESFPHLIDALHTAMMIYDEEGSKACQVFVDREDLRNDARIKALVQALMQAIPTTRDKKNEFLRPEMTTLDAMRLLFWEDLPAPKEEEPPKIDPQGSLFDTGDETEEDEDQQSDDD